ncbi:MAG: aminotransferase class I/II-fold pyridoxal phosphate-dependent enzyme [Proteobacteria bacterium]|nr:aminotransferase class I/II-fold pyridoxal phosphate-dependent enzyme [Pseudomonadota bacterium]
MLKLDFNERADSVPQWLQDFVFETRQLWQYPNRQEVEDLIADEFKVSSDCVFLSNGGDESIELLFKLCKLNNQSILLPLPAFSQYTHQLGIWGVENTVIKSRPDLSIDVESLKQGIKPGQWLVLTRPNNPTGECLPHEILIDLIKKAQSTEAFVFLDEAYIEFYLENNSAHHALEFDHVVSLRTFSKAYGLAGARLGYLLGGADLINQFKRIAMPFNVNDLSLQLARAALQNSSEMKHYCATIANNRKGIYDFLKSCNIEVFDGKGNFLLLKLKAKIKLLLLSFMDKNGIQIKSSVNGLPDWVRITIPENVEKIWHVLRTVFQPEIVGFDMDGVLIDTSASYDVCIVKTVKHFTQKDISISKIIKLREKGGFNNDWDLSCALIKQQGFNVELIQIIKKFQEYYQEYKHNEVNLLTGKDLFNGRYITAIITGRPRKEAEEGVKRLNISPGYIISADDVSEQKPSPQGINWLKVKTAKSRMWFCGDTVDDMQAGVAAHCVCIGIGENSKNLYQAGADIVLNNINELGELL